MSTIETPGNDGPESGVDPAPVPTDGMEIRVLTTAEQMVEVGEVFQQVWGSATDLIRLEMLMAISHADGYVVGAYDTTRGDAGRGDSGRSDGQGEIVGASVAILAHHHGQPALHSHVTGILPGVRSSGLGRAMKLHQREWAIERNIDWIVWTFDPLVRRNAWFNIAVLGAEVHEYLPHFYGTMTDAINAGDDSDRLLVAWATATDPDAALRDGSAGSDEALLIATPDDIVTLRRTDPTAVQKWREGTRAALTAALDAGRSITGFTRAGEYVVGS